MVWARRPRVQVPPPHSIRKSHASRNSMNYAAKERAELSHQHLTLKWGSALKRWAAARRSVWSLDKRTPLDLLRRIDFLRTSNTLWDVLDQHGPEVLRLDRTMCRVADCRWFHWKMPAWAEPYGEHSVQEVVRRAALEIPGIKPARMRHLLAREVKAGHLKRTARGRYIHPPPEWRWLEPEERYPHDEAEARWEERSRRFSQLNADVLLVHYLMPLPVYRKAKALGISDRAYYYRLAHALRSFQSYFEIEGPTLQNVQ
jgi:hypothetical protein